MGWVGGGSRKDSDDKEELDALLKRVDDDPPLPQWKLFERNEPSSQKKRDTLYTQPGAKLLWSFWVEKNVG